MSKKTKRVFHSEKVPPPRVLQTHWNQELPLYLEIGAGVGFHPIHFAKKNPHSQLIAIEKTSEKYQKMHRRFLRHPNLDNLSIAHANAINYVSHYISPESLDGVFLLYPNPNFKNPAQRWARMPFMETLHKKLKPSGTLTLASNESWYIEEAKQHLRTQFLLLEHTTLSLDQKLQFFPRTHFEKKYLERGENCWNLVFTKKKN